VGVGTYDSREELLEAIFFLKRLDGVFEDVATAQLQRLRIDIDYHREKKGEKDVTISFRAVVATFRRIVLSLLVNLTVITILRVLRSSRRARRQWLISFIVIAYSPRGLATASGLAVRPLRG